MYKQFKYFILILAFCSGTVKSVVNTLSANNQMKEAFLKQKNSGKFGSIGLIEQTNKKNNGSKALWNLLKKTVRNNKKYN